MSEELSIRVNFSRAIPIFPLDSVVLLPQQVLPLHIFEPRYRQMVEHSLDGSGQIAMAVFEGGDWKHEYHGRPPIKPAVCVGQIVQHEKLPDGRFNILLQGVCRARLVEESEASLDRLYREAMLEPIGLEDTDTDPETGTRLERMRHWFEEILTEGPLSRLAVADQVLEYVRNEEVPAPALLELVSFALISTPALRYRLLEEGSLERRIQLLEHGLDDLSTLIRKAMAQNPEQWPKGLSWN